MRQGVTRMWVWTGSANGDEVQFFSETPSDYLNQIEALFGAGAITAEARDAAFDDPSSDNYTYYRTSQYDAQQADILTRYKDYNSHEGNSPATWTIRNPIPPPVPPFPILRTSTGTIP